VFRYEQLQNELRLAPKSWLITGVAGFIGSNLLETLLKLNQRVVGLDNFATGHQRNLDEVQSLVSPAQWSNFNFINGDIRSWRTAKRLACVGVDYVLHQAALGSVPRSVADPITTNATNISGFLNMLVSRARCQGQTLCVCRQQQHLWRPPGAAKGRRHHWQTIEPLCSDQIRERAVRRRVWKTYGLQSIGLRYFNVFGPRQDPNGAYAAVIPKWISSMLKGETVFINGDGETSRDFCFMQQRAASSTCWQPLRRMLKLQ
jgi:UDP-N-acetylglucosamine 4-epimerase